MDRRRSKAALKREWRDKVRDIHGTWWYVAFTGHFPYQYLNRTIEGLVGFRINAAKFRTKESAEKAAFRFVADNPQYLGKMLALEK
jgi:hypothetical protein